MATNDYEAIIQWHPEMILISKQPVTWHGFLTVSCNADARRNIRIRLKLIVPKYPSLHDAEVNFGKEIAFIRNEKFSEQVKELIQNATKVSSFLRQLQLLINSIVNNSHVIQSSGPETMDNTALGMLPELEDALLVPSEIQILSDRTLNTIKLSLKNVTVTLQRAKFGPHPWIVVGSDLPEIPDFGPFEKNLTTLAIAKNKLKRQVEIFERAWTNLKQIDQYCWVIDPLQPRPCHLYRRIYLTPLLSMFIKLNPWYPMDLPEIKFMGSEIEVESKRELVSKNLHNWNPQCDIIDNLRMLLNVDTFPRKEENKTMESNNAIFADEECCICFSLELNNEILPDKICKNEKCRRHFHTSCLLQWLQAVAGNHIVFDHIHGSCPNCQESISCCIK